MSDSDYFREFYKVVYEANHDKWLRHTIINFTPKIERYYKLLGVVYNLP